MTDDVIKRYGIFSRLKSRVTIAVLLQGHDVLPNDPMMGLPQSLLHTCDIRSLNSLMNMFRKYVLVFVLLLGCFVREVVCGCPTVDDPCMNEQNHQKCQQLVDKGCTNLIWMESCPLQFACGTYDRSNLRRKALQVGEHAVGVGTPPGT